MTVAGSLATGAIEPAIDVAARVADADVAVVVVALVGLFLFSLHRQRVALGREVRELRIERDWWRDTAVRALDLGERAIGSRSPDG